MGASSWIPDQVRYECAVNIEDLVKLEDVMSQYDLGPNGGNFFLSENVTSNLFGYTRTEYGRMDHACQ